MVDEWDWFWAGEHGRDRLLRDELEYANAAASRASASASRAHSTMRGLRSQLTELQGDVELRLRQLSRAFDAYVELGDIREQLVDYGDTRVIRRDAVRAVESMAAGTPAKPLDAGDYADDYWLIEAVNAVVAIADGRRDLALEQRVVDAEAGGEVFLVACAAALGHGAAVADRLPSVLAGDGTLDPDRRLLARAVLEGRFGAAGERQLGVVVGEALDRVDWAVWCREQAGGDGPEQQLAWLQRFWQGPAVPAAAEEPAPLRVGATKPAEETPAAQPGDGQPGNGQPDTEQQLQQVVSRMVAEGSPAERHLLLRAAELRAVIEHPGRDEEGPPVEERVPVLDWVLALTDDEDPGRRSRALEWLRPHLLQRAAQLPVTLERAPIEINVRRMGWALTADQHGVDAETVRRARSEVAGMKPERPTQAIGCFVGAGAAVLLGLLALTGSIGFAVVLLVVAAGLAGAGWFLLQRHRRQFTEHQQDRRDQLDRAVEEAEQRLASARTAREQSEQDYRTGRESLLARLREPTLPADEIDPAEDPEPLPVGRRALTEPGL